MRRFTTSFSRASYSKTKEKGFPFLWSHSQPVMIVLICYFMLYLLEHRTLGGWVRPSEKPKVLVCDLPHRLHASCTRSREELGVAVAFGHGQVSKLLRMHLRVAGRTWEAGPRMSSPNSQCVLHCSISQVKKSLRQQTPIISLQAGAFWVWGPVHQHWSCAHEVALPGGDIEGLKPIKCPLFPSADTMPFFWKVVFLFMILCSGILRNTGLSSCYFRGCLQNLGLAIPTYLCSQGFEEIQNEYY